MVSSLAYIFLRVVVLYLKKRNLCLLYCIILFFKQYKIARIQNEVRQLVCPCLLFGQKEKGNIKSRYFACAVYRSVCACPYKITVDEEFNIIGEEGVPRKIFEDEDAKPETAAAVKYGCIPKKYFTIPETSSLVFCHTCVDVFEAKHRCPSVVVTRAELQLPSRLLAAKDSHSGEAQFFFSDEALGVLQGAVERSNVDGVLCLGAPRVGSAVNVANFFPAKQFAQYSMLVDHFYDESSPKRLDSFLAECENLLLVCDPPFGAFLDPLMRSIEALKQRHKESRLVFFASSVHSLSNRSWYREKDYWMCDYRVTYANHKVFAKASKTTVRCFTNLKPEVFNLSDVNGYKFCEFCERYVSNNNKHCFMCSACTSKVSIF
ncbi:unnamed protein product [Heligmosomoides polygyrus]|uniref:Zinc finger CCHC domain-containing protein 4 n=1 Tax=Heligmosomoides polygyrus TaxID=6339 RepID=A0A3P8CCG2_HELPZ|nr:unnamed protein product [Heligmosomoides polygyrus]